MLIDGILNPRSSLSMLLTTCCPVDPAVATHIASDTLLPRIAEARLERSSTEKTAGNRFTAQQFLFRKPCEINFLLMEHPV